jgi:SAM-dependent methyltransferase
VRAFRGEYLRVYAHRDEESAAAEAAFALRALRPPPGGRILDLACGAGRHARALATAGLAVVGLDLSPELLRVAASRGGGVRGYVRGDMRALPFPRAFSCVTMFFTSFGYFATDAENDRVLAEVARVLAPGGGFLLDGMNRDAVLAGLVPRSDREGPGDTRIHEARWITPDGRRVEKRVRIFRPDRPVEEYTESVRLYSREELAERLEAAGLAVEGAFGDLAGSPPGPDRPRQVLVGRLPC